MATRKGERPTGCPPHYWMVGRDAAGERWECRHCRAEKRPPPSRLPSWGERACTWSREERFLAGIAE
jgi:hypothetical protein